ncbi:MAG: hypothetical protein ACTSUE_21110 [Promethearchaeota archaeon]
MKNYPMRFNKNRFRTIFFLSLVTTFSLTFITISYSTISYINIERYFSGYTIEAEMIYRYKDDTTSIKNIFDSYQSTGKLVDYFPSLVYGSDNTMISSIEITPSNYTVLMTGLTPEFLASNYAYKMIEPTSNDIFTALQPADIMVSTHFYDELGLNATMNQTLTINFSVDVKINNSIDDKISINQDFTIVDTFNPTNQLDYNWIIFDHATILELFYPPSSEIHDYYYTRSNTNAYFIQNTINQGTCLRYWVFYKRISYNAGHVTEFSNLIENFEAHGSLNGFRSNLDAERLKTILNPNMTYILLFLSCFALMFYYFSEKVFSSIYRNENADFFLGNVKGLPAGKVIFDKMKEMTVSLPLGLTTGLGLAVLLNSLASSLSGNTLSHLLEPESYTSSIYVMVLLSVADVIISLYYVYKYKQRNLTFISKGQGEIEEEKNFTWSKVDWWLWIIGLSGIIFLFLTSSVEWFTLPTAAISVITQASRIFSVFIPVFPILFIYSHIKLAYVSFSLLKKRIDTLLNKRRGKRGKTRKKWKFQFLISQNKEFYKSYFFKFFFFASLLFSFMIVFISMGSSEEIRIKRISEVEAGCDIHLSTDGEIDDFHIDVMENISTCKYIHAYVKTFDVDEDIIAIENNLSKVMYIGDDNFYKLSAGKTWGNLTLGTDEILISYTYSTFYDLKIGDNVTMEVYDKQSAGTLVTTETTKIVGIYYTMPGKQGDQQIFCNYEHFNQIRQTYNCTWKGGIYLNLTLSNGQIYQDIWQDILDYRLNSSNPSLLVENYYEKTYNENYEISNATLFQSVLISFNILYQ